MKIVFKNISSRKWIEAGVFGFFNTKCVYMFDDTTNGMQQWCLH